MKDHLSALPADYRFQEYALQSVLGQGGFGITYRAWDANLDKAVAIKEYLPVDLAVRQGDCEVRPRSSEWAEDYEWGMQKFLEEARTLARFEHPNIVTVMRLFAANGTAYIVMPFQEGESLFASIQRRETFDEARLLSIVLPLLDGLEAVHALGILHRDIKPDNIFLREDGAPVLLDFGAARQALGDKSRSLTTIVSRGYSPFEQYTRRGVQGPWTDIYALAAVMYDMISGEPPLEATDRVQEDSIVPAVEVGNGRFSKSLLTAVDHALSVRSDDRPQSVAEFRGLLERGFGAPRGTIDAGATRRSDALPPDDATMHVGAWPSPPSSPSPPSRRAQQPAVFFSPETLSAAERRLAAYIGPLAGILVKKTARVCQDERQFYEALAAHIDEPEDRRKFLAGVGGRR